MTIRFAAARSSATSPFARYLVKGQPRNADNDIPHGSADAINAVTGAALRHFAEHGLGAAPDARERAEAALANGDSEKFDYWLAICRALDREEATELAKLAAR